MNNTNLTIDADEVLSMFSELSPRNRKKVFKKAIKSALEIVKKQAITNLRGVINPRMIGHRDRYGNSFRKGIKTKVYRDANSGVIHILGNYKLKFFEMGTAQRKNKTRHTVRLRRERNTGSIPAYHFFKRAKQSKEREVFNSLDSLISQSIQRINNRYR